MQLQAFADESFQETDQGGFYVLAAAVLPDDRHDELRAMLIGLRGARKTQKLHWNEMDLGDQLHAAKHVADVDEIHVVCVGAPVPNRRQERARAVCMTTLVEQLHSAGVQRLVAEARTRQLDARDVATVRGARYAMPKGTQFRIEHVRGADEPLLWAADIVAGAVRGRHEGRPGPWEPLRDHIYEIEISTKL